MYFKLVKEYQDAVPAQSRAVSKRRRRSNCWKDEARTGSITAENTTSRSTRCSSSRITYSKNSGSITGGPVLATQICCGEASGTKRSGSCKDKPYDTPGRRRQTVHGEKAGHCHAMSFERDLGAAGEVVWDYPNDEQSSRFIYDTYRKIFKKEKLGSF